MLHLNLHIHKVHIKDLLSKCCIPVRKAECEVKVAANHMKESLRRDALAAKALDNRMTRLYILPDIHNNDVAYIIEHHRRYMNG